ncbi:MOSC domain-containing protein [Longimicrobium terrae]|uniref:MOSC domain-containing protein YiiM n=1 Tax=Longimicrobium terrae TaxID=1639882 RepID=A0A841GW02_9BACT|nr:MOSC domain-containing protein [Longimicrobium terrae]MBB4635420.1 MOSC domain-containing protein YiiM [Longimicrobium terrae]MBB6069814.1 MOSC domain-containing protein YiiM [Longimicrobium terrae]NNC30978.1 MOSC domain-containing protein [Longimicrobium terrae]NNC32736.1 MOSC domain-containing protein [Longimicrobium terrae]
MPDSRILHVNVGAVREVEWRGRLVTTGIWKAPVEGRVALRCVNFAGDDQADRTVHGGPDKAVYAYSREDYDFWREEEGFDTPPGLFGENLTVDGIDLSAALVGERWSVGSTVLEIAQPRMPCFKLGLRVGDAHFPRRFQRAGRPGAYFRVVQEGEVGAGDAVRVLERPDHGITLRYMTEVLTDRGKAAALRAVPNLPEFWDDIAHGRIALE